ncbi:putative F-box domain-containing protein [Rosa chinensis]|uniref:Putative F-box domain-containing protein n=1 Tax=Rosa chinensis TaxID=74649 RepID=A0A2P6S651_ROSCH|nr:F-box protein At5g07610 [Rosa chinensis]XP_024184977.1 F-box protein At5g07610 [Rosa chinensis]XP_024184978.1 F-box protein At5g07610 [Rosa chinensis]PRQ54160.1 putative F-box domain-containing protein [Rosa chinensis]
MEHRFYPKRCTSSLAETVASIEQVLTEILVRVPAKPLVRFKCVSKHWLSLISDPKFCHRHTLQNPNTPVSAVFCDRSCRPFCFVPIDLDHMRGTSSTSSNIRNHGNQNPFGSGSPTCNPLDFVQNQYDYGIKTVHTFPVNRLHFDHKSPSRSRSLPFNPLTFAQNQYHDDIRIIQSCNGLFLCLLFHNKLNPPYLIFNPTTNQFSTLIPPPITAVTTATGERKEHYVSTALAFDPSKSPHYKVVCLRTIDGSEDGTIYHIVIYSSETQSWRILNFSIKRVFSILYARVVYWKGAIHWLGMFSEVAYFHIDEERDGFIDNRPHFYENDVHRRKCRYFQESHDGHHLYLIDIYRPCITKFEVFEMGKDYSGWFVKYLVDIDPICRWNLSDRFVVLFLDQDENEEEESSSLLLHMPGKLISYNLKSKTYKSLDLTPKPGVNDSLLRVEASNHRYMETLACV